MAGVLRVLRHDGAVGRAGRIGAFIVEDDLHSQTRRLCDHQPQQAKVLVREITHSPRKPEPGMRRHAPESGLVEGVELVEQHRLLQVVVPKPQRDQAELARRIGKSGMRLTETHGPSP